MVKEIQPSNLLSLQGNLKVGQVTRIINGRRTLTHTNYKNQLTLRKKLIRTHI